MAARLLRPVTQQGIAQGRRWGKFWVSQETQRLLTVSLQSGARSAAGSGAQRTALRGPYSALSGLNLHLTPNSMAESCVFSTCSWDSSV